MNNGSLEEVDYESGVNGLVRLTVEIDTFHVNWTGDVTGSCPIELVQAFTWDYVRKYICDNYFDIGVKPSVDRIRVRIFSRAI